MAPWQQKKQKKNREMTEHTKPLPNQIPIAPDVLRPSNKTRVLRIAWFCRDQMLEQPKRADNCSDNLCSVGTARKNCRHPASSDAPRRPDVRQICPKRPCFASKRPTHLDGIHSRRSDRPTCHRGPVCVGLCAAVDLRAKRPPATASRWIARLALTLFLVYMTIGNPNESRLSLP